MDNITPTAGVVIINNNKVLLVRASSAKHLAGLWGIPGGRLHEKEEDVDGAIRELKEETGLTVLRADLIKLPRIWTAGNFSMVAFVAKVFKGELVESDEGLPEWIDMDKLDLYDLRPNIKDIIQTALNNA